MYNIKRTIKSGKMIEIEYYKSIRKPGKYYGGRGVRKGLSAEKQKKANKIRTQKKWQRIILCNFLSGDWWCRFSAPFGTFTSEKQFRQAVRNWVGRIKTRLAKMRVEFKYIGFIECGKLGKNWHLHIILSDKVRKIAQKCWYYDNGINFTPLYEQGNFKELAEYILKDSCGEKRMLHSKHLLHPEITVKQAGVREVRKLDRGEAIKIPSGYYLAKDDPNYNYNDITGATWYFKLLPLAFRKYDN